MFTGIGACDMFGNQINSPGEGAFHLGGLVAAVVALQLGLPASVGRCSDPAQVSEPFLQFLRCLKIKTNSSILVSSLMLNYISLWFATFILMHFICDRASGIPHPIRFRMPHTKPDL